LVGPPNQTYAWTGPGLLADVQHWLVQPQANHGWLLRGDELTLLSAKRFESRENTAVANRPQLELMFDPPAAESHSGDVPLPAWALAALALALAGALRRGTRP
jgi:MYXO-CTERM domain-containing protein